jgi:trypsin
VVAGVVRETSGFAMHPAWRHGNGPHNVFDDVAIVGLAQPVTDVAPVALAGAPVNEARILGTGRSTAPGSGASEKFGGGLRDAVLRPITDSECARAFRHRPGNGGEHFNAPRMLCAIDADGLAPLSSGCNGDSGGPLYAGTPAAPVLLGVVSWGGSRCGADHLPSVFADVAR